ncbi:MAG: transcription antitermination factor NusB [Eubacteriales bacterium]|nr:transcription antitermination factor NusB [Eubacteriales bacterium]
MLKHPRRLVLELLCRCEQGEHCNVVLAAALRETMLAPRERKFVSALFYGTLRWQPRIDFELQEVLNKRLQSFHPEVRNLLRLGLYQIDYAYSVPPEVAVATTVSLAEEVGQQQAKSMINAVLRKLSKVRKRLLTKQESLKYGLSTELFGLFKQAYGIETARRIAEVFLNERQELSLRPNLLHPKYNQLPEILQAEGIELKTGTYLEDSLSIITGGRDLASLASFQEGLWSVQDEAAQLVSRIADLSPGTRVLDACAAPGGKTADLFARNGGDLFILAAELKAERFKSLEDIFNRLNYPKASELTANRGIYPQLRDASQALADAEIKAFDAVLLDVPCTASGLIGKQADLRSKLSYEKFQSLLPIQAKILNCQAEAVKNSGVLIYSTCSILPAENSEQIAKFLQSPLGREFERVEIEHLIPEKLRQCAIQPALGELLLRPDLSPEIDGFFIAKLRRKDG